MKDYSKALSYFERALDIKQRTLHPNHPSIRNVKESIEISTLVAVNHKLAFMATVASVSNKPSTRVQWMWNSNANPFSKSQKVEWRRYSDVETMIIEKAFTADESCAMLDEYHIDFKHNLQISNNDTGKQRPVERVMWDKDDKVLREERFLPNPVAPDLPFGGQYGFISPFIKEVVKDLNLTKKQSPSKDNTVVLIIVEKAALEKQEFACNGRRCATCGECREWYFTGDLGSWKWIHSVKDWGGDNTARWFNHYLFTRFKNRDDAKCVESDEVLRAIYYTVHLGCLCEDNCVHLKE
ncbi:unnamed protein product [Adineta steineri]|uniref:WWE domain-containing protein n=1 Tax=Adineta steineri TaxID=433720 RepID=A0A819MT53_9BILA|nr:unnamed protein product [Adineta steineri]